VSKSCKLDDQSLGGLSFQTLEMVRFSADQYTSTAIHKMLGAGTRLTSLDIDIVDYDRRRVADILGVLAATPSLATLTIAGKDDCLSPTHWINETLHKIEDSLTFVPPFALPIAQVARHHQSRWTFVRLSQLPQAA
jgi:hypothetical protein